MKRYYPLCLLIVLFISCKKSSINGDEQGPEKFSSTQIDAFIREKMETDKKFEWSSASDNMVWSALQESDHILSVGYKPVDETNVEGRLATINIQDAKWVAARQAVLDIILTEERKLNKDITIDKLVQWEENVLPVVDVYVENLSTVKMLRASKLVRYAEPMGYEPRDVASKVESSSGCSNIAEPGLIDNVDYTTILPGCKQSWNLVYHGIPAAWSRSTGAGVKVFFVDTGCEYDQENLGSALTRDILPAEPSKRSLPFPGVPSWAYQQARWKHPMMDVDTAHLWPVPVALRAVPMAHPAALPITATL